ncbi:hypothetical protein [Marinicella meishanensis]|uniref:hypothetical protein n=1 Tax=Marinicella meishanensis TaxID=2873263 RepID=UPI001CC04288|nr:hypothetical protein [Marinicella sp. NBU2979]
MKTVALLMLMVGSAQAANLAYELNEGKVLKANPNNATYTLNTSPALGLITAFVGPCGGSECTVPKLNPFTISYTVSGATFCSGSGGIDAWLGIKPSADGTYEIEVPFLAADTSFVLSCSAGALEHSLVINILVDEQNSNCSDVVFPPGLTAVANTYRQINEGFDFGQSTNSTVELTLSNNEFAAISGFFLDQTNFRRRIVFEQAPTNYNLIESATITVSECPGDFTDNAVCKRTVNNFSNMFFSTNPADNPVLYCIMDPTKTYYINYVTTPDPYNEAPYCQNGGDTECTIFYSETSF